MVVSTPVMESNSSRKTADHPAIDIRRLIPDIVDAAPVSLYIHNCETRQRTFLNEYTRIALAYDENDESRQKFMEFVGLMHPDDVLRLPAHHERVEVSPSTLPKEFEYRLRHRDGAWRWFLSRDIAFERTSDGRLLKILGAAMAITDRKIATDALRSAKREAENATFVKSRLIAAAGHDLRQPLQSLTLLQGMLTKSVEGEKTSKMVLRIGETVMSMSAILSALLDVNQIGTEEFAPRKAAYSVNQSLSRLKEEFAGQAKARNVEIRVAPSSVLVHSDQRLFEQVVRTLLMHTLRNAKNTKILLGCRRGPALRVELYGAGAEISQREIDTMLDGLQSSHAPGSERDRGLDLGLFIVTRLSKELGYNLRVRSRTGTGSVFSIEIPVAEPSASLPSSPVHAVVDDGQSAKPRSGSVMIVEDDPQVRELLEVLLKTDGHRTLAAHDGMAALGVLAHGKFHPDVILADYNLPGDVNGLQFAARVREKTSHDLPVIILTGDASPEICRDIAFQKCIPLSKPVKLAELRRIIQHELRAIRVAGDAVRSQAAEPQHDRSAVYVVDDDFQTRENLREMLEGDGLDVECYADCESFLEAWRPGRKGCLLVDAYLPGMNGIELLQRLKTADNRVPAIMITGNSDVAMAVQAMKAGALDFIEKPIGANELLASIGRALEESRGLAKISSIRVNAAEQMAGLTSRQREIMQMVLAGHPSKNIAADLGISQRTVENHRAAIMKRMGAKSIPALARLAFAANSDFESSR